MFAAILVQDFWRSDNITARTGQILLYPLSVLFSLLVKLRRICYQIGILRAVKLPVPTIVVGNISVGGNGKTPLVIYLAEILRQHGLRPGIMCRGYKGKRNRPCIVSATKMTAADVGDEAYMLATVTQCPVVVSRKRAAGYPLLPPEVNVVLLDDGLQHYALKRDIEIAVVDSNLGFGNGMCLPAGPLREPESRLREVDFLVTKGREVLQLASAVPRFIMDYSIIEAHNVLRGSRVQSLADFAGETVHAVAGIANPKAFFQALRDYGIIVIEHAFPDHHAYMRQDFDFDDENPVVMTAKDAVKCSEFATNKFWQTNLEVVLEPEFTKGFLAKVDNLIIGGKQ